MKGIFLVVLLGLVFCLSLSSQAKETATSSGDLEKELRATLERYEKAVNEGDLDTITEIEGEAIGYGCRTPAPRLLFNKKLINGFSIPWRFSSGFRKMILLFVLLVMLYDSTLCEDSLVAPKETRQRLITRCSLLRAKPGSARSLM